MYNDIIWMTCFTTVKRKYETGAQIKNGCIENRFQKDNRDTSCIGETKKVILIEKYVSHSM